MGKRTAIIAIFLAFVLVLSGCGSKTPPNSTATEPKIITDGNVTDRTDYVMFYQEPFSLSGMEIHQYIVGHPVPEASVIKQKAYFVPWKIYFSQVQLSDNFIYTNACQKIKDQEVFIDGWIDLDLANTGVTAAELPQLDSVSIKGTVHETVTGVPGQWACESDLITNSANQGSSDYVQKVSGTHVESFADASNMGSMTINGATIYLDLSMSGNIQMIWPAGTKIEFAPAGTPNPLEALPSTKL